MKSISTRLLALFVSGAVFAGELSKNDVPVPVMKAFLNQFEGFSNANWSKSGSEYEVKFVKNDARFETKYNAEGIWLETAHMLRASEVPPVIKGSVAKRHEGSKVLSAKHVKDMEGNSFYRVRVEGTAGEQILKLDDAGEPMRQ